MFKMSYISIILDTQRYIFFKKLSFYAIIYCSQSSFLFLNKYEMDRSALMLQAMRWQPYRMDEKK